MVVCFPAAIAPFLLFYRALALLRESTLPPGVCTSAPAPALVLSSLTNQGSPIFLGLGSAQLGPMRYEEDPSWEKLSFFLKRDAPEEESPFSHYM